MLGAEDYRGISHIGEKFQWKQLACDILAEYAAVPSLRGGGQGDHAPQTTACAPHFGLLRIRFWASRYNKTTGNNGKMNNNV